MWNLPVQKRQSALRGCLHVESTIDSYGEVIDRFGRRLAAEPLTVLTHLTAGQVVDPPAESGTSTWALSCEPSRSTLPGQAWICMLNPGERSAEAHR